MPPPSPAPRPPLLLALLLPLLGAAAACTAPDALPPGPLSAGPEAQGAAELSAGDFRVSWSGAGPRAQLRVTREGRTVYESVPGRAFAGAGQGEAQVKEARGLFTLTDRLTRRCPAQRLDALGPDGAGGVLLQGVLACDGGGADVPFTLRLTPRGPRRLAFALTVEGPGVNRTALSLASVPDEGVHGFGEQFTHFDLKGARVPVLVSEQGIGRGSFPLTPGADLQAGAGGDWSTSYAPVPHLLTSRLRSLFLENTEYSQFDLREPDRIGVEVHAAGLRGELLAGDSPLELVREYTGAVGRMRRLPDWVLSGAVVGMQGGTARVREVLAQLEAAGAPLAAFWLQDWVGQRVTTFGRQLWWNWELDPERYPGWDGLVADLAGRNVRVMTYVNPFLADVESEEEGRKPAFRRNLFREAREQGFLVREPSGAPALILNTSFRAGLVDLTNPAARAWMKGVLREEVLGAGASGWMADFGEALPWDAQLARGAGPEVHNAYPELWAELNREAVREAGREEDAVFFMRAGFTRSPRHATLFWLGDQVVSWDAQDGLKSAVTGMLTGGLSGFALNHSDIGGYTTIPNPLQTYARSPELLQRWAELSAFTTVFRTHEGNRPDLNAQVYSSPELLAHFARMARVYRAWLPYRRQLVDEAAASGAPVARHLFLHHPEDPVARTLTHEAFLVGSELLVAPVTEPGRTTARAYLPRGRWVHVWSDAELGSEAAGSWVTVDAPLGRPAVFHRKGSAAGDAFREALRAEGLR